MEILPIFPPWSTTRMETSSAPSGSRSEVKPPAGTTGTSRLTE